MAASKSFIVLGGAGFLGSHIVEQLISRGEQTVAVYDAVEPADDEIIEGVKYFYGDITDEEKLVDVFKETAPSVVFHTVSPRYGLPPEVYHRVNDVGTRAIVSACRKTGVEKLVYTSSVGVVWIGKDIAGLNEEELPLPSKGYDAYHHTKAIAERIVLSENGWNGMRTVILRPCGMIGERDKQLIWRLAEVLSKGQQNVQIGDNKNLIDYVYAGNVAYAHLLAADRLFEDPEAVAGQRFFITNGEPRCPWDFNRIVWRWLGDDGKKPIVNIPTTVGLVMAWLAELWCAVVGGSTQFTIYNVRFCTGVQWYNIDKAKTVLGYEPKVTLEDGIERSLKWWKDTGAQRHVKSGEL